MRAERHDQLLRCHLRAVRVAFDGDRSLRGRAVRLHLQLGLPRRRSGPLRPELLDQLLRAGLRDLQLRAGERGADLRWLKLQLCLPSGLSPGCQQQLRAQQHQQLLRQLLLDVHRACGRIDQL